MSASLAAAKRRRAPGSGTTPTTSNSNTNSQQSRNIAPMPNQLNPTQAIMVLAEKLGRLETFARSNLEGVEEKFAEQDKFLADNLTNTPDVDQINSAFADLDARLTKLEDSMVGVRNEVRQIKETDEEREAIIEGLVNQISNIQSQIVDTMKIPEDITTIKEVIEDISNRINTLEGNEDD